MQRWLLIPLLRLMSHLPFWFWYRISDLLFLLLYHVIGYRKKVVKRNLSSSFPDKSSPELKSIERKFYRHLCDVVVEAVKCHRISRKALADRVLNDDNGLYYRLYKEGRSCIAVMGHCGNFEWIPPFAAISVPHFTQGLYHPLKNEAFENFTRESRGRFGSGLLPMDIALRTMIEQRKQGELTATAFIADQTPSAPATAYWTVFLNQETPFFTGTAKIAKKMGLALSFIAIYKEKRGHYRCVSELICEDASTWTEEAINEAWIRRLEQNIAQQPWNWLWSHRRWKHSRPEGITLHGSALPAQ
jgi:KDO2-lipid IV(A) lauroyltransferase